MFGWLKRFLTGEGVESETLKEIDLKYARKQYDWKNPIPMIVQYPKNYMPAGIMFPKVGDVFENEVVGYRFVITKIDFDIMQVIYNNGLTRALIVGKDWDKEKVQCKLISRNQRVIVSVEND